MEPASINPTRRAEPSAVTHLLFRMVLLIVSGAVFLGAVNYLVQNRRLWYWTPLSNDELLKYYALATDPQKYDVLIAGSSVSLRGLMPAVVEEELARGLLRPEPWRVYNASIPAAMFPAYLELMRGIVGRYQHPQVVVLVLAVRDFNAASRSLDRQLRYFTKTPNDYWLVWRYAPRWGERWAVAQAWLHGTEAILQTPAYFSVQARVQEFQARHGATYFYPVTGEGQELNQKLLPPAEKSVEDLRRSRIKETRDKLLPDFQISPLIDAWFQEVIRLAKRRQTKLLILLAPESQEFARAVYTSERQTVEKYLAVHCLQEGVPCSDLGQEPFRPAEADYFDGCDHLGPRGAEKLSRAVSRSILVPALSALDSSPARTEPGDASGKE